MARNYYVIHVVSLLNDHHSDGHGSCMVSIGMMPSPTWCFSQLLKPPIQKVHLPWSSRGFPGPCRTPCQDLDGSVTDSNRSKSSGWSIFPRQNINWKKHELGYGRLANRLYLFCGVAIKGAQHCVQAKFTLCSQKKSEVRLPLVEFGKEFSPCPAHQTHITSPRTRFYLHSLNLLTRFLI